jgi:hypothetical protein
LKPIVGNSRATRRPRFFHVRNRLEFNNIDQAIAIREHMIVVLPLTVQYGERQYTERHHFSCQQNQSETGRL